MASKARKDEALRALEPLEPKVTLIARANDGGKWKQSGAPYDEQGQILPNVLFMHGKQVELAVCYDEPRYVDPKVDATDTRIFHPSWQSFRPSPAGSYILWIFSRSSQWN